jgi:Tol biopolymer transport system component
MYMPDVSPRGDQVLFFKSVDGVMQVFTVRLDGTDLRQVTFGAAESRHPRWSGDGRSIFSYQQKPNTACGASTPTVGTRPTLSLDGPGPHTTTHRSR